MIVDSKGQIFEDRRKNDRRKDTDDKDPGRRKNDRRKESNKIVKTKKKSK